LTATATDAGIFYPHSPRLHNLPSFSAPIAINRAKDQEQSCDVGPRAKESTVSNTHAIFSMIVVSSVKKQSEALTIFF
jgi:hypothetical protein